MRITTRIAKLEQTLGAGLSHCDACGGIDPVTRTGPFFPGVVLRLDDGTCWCMCKRCGFMFNARLVEEGGRFLAHDVRPDPGPV